MLDALLINTNKYGLLQAKEMGYNLSYHVRIMINSIHKPSHHIKHIPPFKKIYREVYNLLQIA